MNAKPAQPHFQRDAIGFTVVSVLHPPPPSCLRSLPCRAQGVMLKVALLASKMVGVAREMTSMDQPVP